MGVVVGSGSQFGPKTSGPAFSHLQYDGVHRCTVIWSDRIEGTGSAEAAGGAGGHGGDQFGQRACASIPGGAAAHRLRVAGESADELRQVERLFRLDENRGQIRRPGRHGGHLPGGPGQARGIPVAEGGSGDSVGSEGQSDGADGARLCSRAQDSGPVEFQDGQSADRAGSGGFRAAARGGGHGAGFRGTHFGGSAAGAWPLDAAEAYAKDDAALAGL